jgi:hypothetical protein
MRFAFLLSLALAAGVAQADVRARVVATDPPAEATLGRDQAFYVRIQFDADEPVSFWTRAYSRGKQLGGWKSNASAKWSGSGHALGWISFSQPVEVDEIRVIAGGGKPYIEREVAAYPVKLRWGEGAAAEATAPWVAQLKQVTSAAWEAERRAEAARPASTWEVVLGLLIPPVLVALVLACVGAPLWALWKWRGGWRLAAALPFAAIAFVVGRIVIDTARDPTSHNLWPLEIVLYGAAGLAFIVLLALVRHFTGAVASRS